MNKAFVYDVEVQNNEVEKPVANEMSNTIFDEIHIYNETTTTVEFTEINNNVYYEERKELEEDEQWRSVAEVHAAPAGDHSQDGTHSESIVEDSSVDEPEELRTRSDVAEVFGRDAPQSMRTSNNARVKVVHEKDLILGNGQVSEIGPEDIRVRKRQTLLNSDIREKLSKILQEQASFIRSGLERPSVDVDRGTVDTAHRLGNHTDIKTLSKAEIVNKLQHLLKNGPPKKPYYRKSAFIDEKQGADAEDI